MKMNGADIRKQEFPVRLRGYDKLDVDAFMHLAAVMDRRGHRRIADWLRRRIPMARIERGISGLLRTRFKTVTTGFGGAALDVDNDADLEVVDKMLFRWKERQARLARNVPEA